MADILIKNMEMPKNCSACKCVQRYRYSDECEHLEKPIARNGRLKDCPLIPAPEHGRLIDVDAYIKTEMDEYRKHGNKYGKERAETIADVLAVLDKHTPVVLERTT